MQISEIYSSRQGEGRLTGTPSVFVRTSGCNLRCDFCDTPFASWSPEGVARSVEDVVRQVCFLAKQEFEPIRHVVLTGGEPMLPREIEALTARLRNLNFHITIETAGTILRDLACDLMSISPKFANSTPSAARAGAWRAKHESSRYRPDVVRQLMDQYDYQLKFVVDQPSDLHEILEFLTTACPNWQQQPELIGRVMLMPQGIDMDSLREKERWLQLLCEEHGFSLCPRKHIEWYGNRRGT
jgi:7-carboxy-7-deazaguanine synthase